MASINRIARALLVVSALSLPALASAEGPTAGSNKPAAAKDAQHKHAPAKPHKAAEAKPKAK